MAAGLAGPLPSKNSQPSANQIAENCLESLRRLARAGFDKALHHSKKRRSHEPLTDRPLHVELRVAFTHRERLPYSLLEALPQYSWGAARRGPHQSFINPWRRLHMRQEGSGIQRAWIVRLRYKHGCDDTVELRPQQVILRGIVGIESGAPNASFSCDVADADVAVSAPMKKFDERSIEMLACSGHAPVFPGRTSADIRDTCRFVFGKCHSSTFSVVWRD